VEASVFFDSVEEVGRSIVTCVSRQSVQCLCEDIIEDYRLREVGSINTSKNWERVVVRTVATIHRCKENCRIYERPRHLFGVYAPCVVLGCGLRFLITVVAVEITECTATLLDDVDAERPIVLDVPAEFVAVVDIEFSTDVSGNIRLIPGHLALRVDALTTHERE
jgi:hypothetical protein